MPQDELSTLIDVIDASGVSPDVKPPPCYCGNAVEYEHELCPRCESIAALGKLKLYAFLQSHVLIYGGTPKDYGSLPMDAMLVLAGRDYQVAWYQRQRLLKQPLAELAALYEEENTE